jgi:hypothetical protein
MTQKTVIINGMEYDIQTGMPVERAIKSPKLVSATRPQHSQAVHQAQQKSKTLNRRVVKKTAPMPVHTVVAAQNTPQQEVKKYPTITKFAAHPTGVKKPQAEDIAPIQHPIAVKAHQQHAAAKAAVVQPMAPKPSAIIKQEAISQALNAAPAHHQAANKQQPKQPRKFSRFMSVGSAGIALLLLGGYFTYLNMPNLSVRVAAAQAGVDAKYPEYRPDGYGLSGAVAYGQGEVNMKFTSNGGPQDFTLSQKKSSWDSSAVLDNYVKEKAGENYITYSERGLTIYTYGSNAAWVNNGVLYTIDGDAPLSSDQIRRIATSL